MVSRVATAVLLFLLFAASSAAALDQAIEIEPGFNFVSLDVTPDAPLTSDGLLLSRPEVAQVFKFDGVRQAFIYKLRITGMNLFGDNFPIAAGEGCVVKATEAFTLTLPGVASLRDPLPELAAGFNFIGMQPYSGMSARTLLPIRAEFASIFRWKKSASAFEFVLKLGDGSLFGTDFPLEPGTGYFLRATGPAETIAPVAPPTFDPAPGIYARAQSVSLSCATAGATIRYTLDGPPPGFATGTVYDAPFPVPATTTVRAVAFKNGMLDSPLAEAIFTIDTVAPVVSAPVAAAQTLKPGAVSTSTISSSKNGIIYLLLHGENASTAAEIAAAVAANKAFTGRESAAAGEAYPVTVPAGAPSGLYDLVAVDLAGNVSATVPGWLTVGNNPTVATAADLSTPEDTPREITLAATDPDGDPLTYAVATQPARGTLTGTAPNLTYTPAANYHGPDSFTFQANDGTVNSAPATVTITVTPVNDVPVATAASVTTNEDTAKAITLAGTDVDGDTLTCTVVTQPAHGALTGTAPTLTYTPAANYHGPDSFTFTANDGTVDSAPATVTITVTAVNDVPVATVASVTTEEDTAKAITLAGTDVDGDTLTCTVVTQPAHGALTGTAPTLTYTPAANYHGPDSFTFQANDGTVNSAPATVTITVTPVNDVPVATAASITTEEDPAKAITLAGTDADGDNLTYTVLTQPAQGVLTGTAPTLTYTPAANYHGPDSFTFKVNDGTADSAPATVTITVTPVNDVPVATAASVTTNEDTAKAITLAGTDVEGSALTYTVVTQPAHGALTGTAPTLTYTPAANFNSNDSFTFKVNDGTADSAPATVTITVTPVNDVPVATAASVTTNEDTAKAITLAGTDVEGSALTYTVVTQPAHGALTGTAPTLTYTPAANFNSNDSFTFKVNDGTADSAPATVTITVTAVNDVSVATAASVTTNEDTEKAITLAGTDADGDNLTYTVLTQPAHGALTGTAPNYTYTPAANYHGPDSFDFKANDGTVDSAVETVTITVTAVNDVPVATAASVTTNEDTEKAITLAGTDADGDNLTYTVLTQPAHGALTGTAPNYTYTPAANYHGPDSFDFKVNDGTVDSAVETVTITVTAVNDAPTLATNTGLGLAEGATGTITSAQLAASDADDSGAGLTYTVTTLPANGALKNGGVTLALNGTFTQADIAASGVTYVHDGGETVADSFIFTLADGGENGAAAVAGQTFPLTVTPVNDAPALQANAGATLTEGDTGKILTTALLNEGDPDDSGAGLTYTVTTLPAGGTLKKGGSALALNGTFTQADIDDNLITYDHDGGEATTDGFVFTLADGGENGAVALSNQSFAFTVTPVNEPPAVATNTGLGLAEGATGTITSAQLAASDVDDSGAGLTYTVTTLPANGALKNGGVTLALNGTFTQADIDGGLVAYVHDGGETVADSFVFTLADGGENGAAAVAGQTFHLTVTPVNDAPTLLANAGATLAEYQTGKIVTTALLNEGDPDDSGAGLTYNVTTLPAGGTIKKSGSTLALNGTFTQADIDGSLITYNHAGGEEPTDSFVFTLADGGEDGAAPLADQSFLFTVTPVNDSPVLATNASVVGVSDTLNTVTRAGIEVTDVDNPPNEVIFTVESLPATISLYNNGTPVNAGGTFTQEDINENRITYQLSSGNYSAQVYLTAKDLAGVVAVSWGRFNFHAY